MNSFSPESGSALLKIQIGPVQEFISQARSTRDLWSGSYLLSWLMAAGIRHLCQQVPAAELIFPNPTGQLLLKQPWAVEQPPELLTPNLSNMLVAVLPNTSDQEAAQAAMSVQQTIEEEWRKIAAAVWAEHAYLNLPADEKNQKRFHAQVDRHLSISWLVTPMKAGQDDAAGYREAYDLNAWHLDAVRQTRDFKAWSAGGWELLAHGEKDSLSGREEAVAGGKAWRQKMDSEYAHLFKHDDYLGAVNLIKRVWHLAYLKKKEELPASHDEFKIRSTRAIANRDTVPDHCENVELATGEKYLAAIAFDGDSIGKWLSGTFLPGSTDLRAFHEEFSGCLSRFALEEARRIVEGYHGGFLIYAGGDDVVALVPADAALACAQALRSAFRRATDSIHGEMQDETTRETRREQPDASAGIAMAHFKFPLQDLIREAQNAERRAKNDLGRSACAVTLLKRSGEMVLWGAGWESNGLALHEAVFQALAAGWLSTRFPHRVCELLNPYLNHASGLRQRQDAPGFDAHAVIRLEFSHALERQGKKDAAAAAQLLQKLDDYLSRVPPSPQLALQAVIGLCQSVAFIHRNRGPTAPPASTGTAFSHAAFETTATASI